MEFAIVVCFEDEMRERFLMTRHGERGWELPGGRIEPHEAPRDAALREFAEETGHRLLGARHVLTQDRRNGRCHVFEGRFGPAIKDARRAPSEAIVEHRFVSRLSDVAPLAFPDDPYDEIERALGRRLRRGPTPRFYILFLL